MPEIRLDGDWLLKRIEYIEDQLNQIRKEAAMGMPKKPSTPGPRLQGVDLTIINWLKKGSKPASVGDPWAWAFAYDQDGSYVTECKTLVQAIEQYGNVEMDGYVMTLSGRDKNLLNRKKMKPKDRRR